jgi:hypothetical protein
MSENRARGFNRRIFLKGTAAASLGTAAAAAGVTPAGVSTAAAEELAPMPPHGAELRGMDLVVKSPTTEGRFGFMFKNQPPFPASDTLLDRLGKTMEEQPTAEPASEDTQKDDNDRWNENPSPFLSSGVTFLGQFVDHDITFDTTLLSEQESDPYATTNFRTPRYDLDAIYGRGPGPDQDPQFYNPNDRDKFFFVETPYNQITGTLKTSTGLETKTWDVKQDTVYDVPRTGAPETADDPPKGTAKIADPRNDQTLIILQLHIAMQKFHNRLVDYMRAAGVPRAAVFESARRLARWHYQWIVIHEFLPAIVGTTTANSVYKETSKAPTINIKYYKPTNSTGRPFIPVEFAVAAYRFGHSMTRPRYTVRDVFPPTGTTKLGSVSGVPLFDAAPPLTDPETLDDNRLNGHRELLPRLKIQWSKFFNVDPKAPTARPVRQFDASLAHPLFQLPANALPDSNTLGLLSQRNLRRGRKMGLPSGQQLAKLMGVTPLTPTQLYTDRSIKVTIPIASSNIVETKGVEEVVNQDLKNLFEDPLWPGETPLWFYILKEAEHVGDVGAVDAQGVKVDGRGRTLGPVGGRIVAEVLVGLLQKDVNSYLYLQPTWKPAAPIATTPGKFTMADLLKFAGVWS